MFRVLVEGVDRRPNQVIDFDGQMLLDAGQDFTAFLVQVVDPELVLRIGGHDGRRHFLDHLHLREGLCHRLPERCNGRHHAADLVAPPAVWHLEIGRSSAQLFKPVGHSQNRTSRRDEKDPSSADRKQDRHKSSQDRQVFSLLHDGLERKAAVFQ